MEVLWSIEEPPNFLYNLSLLMDFFYNPFHTPSDPDHMATFWPEHFSRWLKVLVVFTLGALPDCVAEVFSDHLDFDP